MEENVVEKFLKECRKIRTPSSRQAYKSHLNNYFRAINKEPVGYITKDVRKLENGERIDTLDRYQNDVLTFAKSIEGRPPKSQVVLISVVKKFLTHFYLDLPQRFWDDISIRAVPIVEKKTPTRDQLKFILDRGDIKHKTLFMMAATSGCRIRELLSLTFNDVDIENRIIRVKDNKAKKGYSRTTFFTEEAKQYLERWLNIRDDFIKSKRKKSKEEKVEGFVDNRIFPYNYHLGRALWVNLLEKAGHPFNQKDNDARLRNKHGRYMYNEHCLRRFFKTNFRTSGLSDKYLNYMIGHDPEMSVIYTDDDQFALKVKEQYDKYSSALTVFSDAGKIRSVLEPKITQQDILIAHQRNEIDALKLQVNEMQDKIKDVDKHEVEEHFKDESYYYELKDRDNRIAELENKLEIVIEAVKNMSK